MKDLDGTPIVSDLPEVIGTCEGRELSSRLPLRRKLVGAQLSRHFSAATIVVAALTSARPTSADAPCGRYVTTSETVYDTKTHLTWERAFVSGATWGSKDDPGTAQLYCAALALEGGGWRLPTAKELFSLADVATISGIDLTAFPGVKTSLNFWTSTPSTNPCEANYGWMVFFQDGGGTLLSEPNLLSSVRCVK